MSIGRNSCSATPIIGGVVGGRNGSSLCPLGQLAAICVDGLGFDFPGLMRGIVAEEQTPRSKAQIIALLHDEGERWAKWLESQSDEFLAERVTFPSGMTPPTKTRFEMLLGSKEHEMHHRGQLMLIERMVGIVPHLTRQMQERMAAASSGSAR